MTEQEWLECGDPFQMLDFLRGRASHRKLLLFAVSCVRPHVRLWRHNDPTWALDLTDKFLQGLAIAEYEEERQHYRIIDEQWAIDEQRGDVTIRGPVRDWLGEALFAGDAWEAAGETAGAVARRFEVEYYREHRNDVGFNGHGANEHRQVALTGQAVLIRDIFGNPFRPALIDPVWLTATAVSLAAAIYADRAFDRLPILADALEDAGCTNADLLSHCRQPGEHVRGCWPVDWLLGKS
jgi:hypothetical protein